MPIVVALGTSWRKSSSCFAPSTPEKKTTPVTLPPGRLRLATRPSLTGSPPLAKPSVLSRLRPWPPARRGAVADDHGHRPANQFGHQSRQPINLIVRIAVFDRDVLALDEACFLQTLAERGFNFIASKRRADVLRKIRPPAWRVAARAPQVAMQPPHRRAPREIRAVSSISPPSLSPKIAPYHTVVGGMPRCASQQI